jgi:hypothetical protein
MLSILEMRIPDFKYHLDPEINEAKITLGASCEVKFPSSGEKNRFLVVLEIVCETQDVEDFYCRFTARTEVHAPEDVPEDCVNDEIEKILPEILNQVSGKVNTIVNTLEMPPLDFINQKNLGESLGLAQ